MQRFLSTLILAICAPAYAMGWAAPESTPATNNSALAGGVDRCEVVLDTFNKAALGGQIDPAQLADIVRSLASRRKLPAYFVTKIKPARRDGRPDIIFPIYLHCVENPLAAIILAITSVVCPRGNGKKLIWIIVGKSATPNGWSLPRRASSS